MRLGKPVVAAIEGYAVAGGLELALWCDLRVAAADATLGVFCRRWGVPLIDGGTVRLPRLIGAGRAMDLVLTGRAVTADEAERIGLVDRVVPPGTARQHADALAAELADFPQQCLRNDRLSLLGQQGLDEEAALRQELAYGGAVAAGGRRRGGAQVRQRRGPARRVLTPGFYARDVTPDWFASPADARDRLGRARATSPTRRPPRRPTSPARSRSRCWSRVRPGWARPSSPRPWPKATGADLVRLQCYEGLDEARALYEWNYKKQLLRIQASRWTRPGSRPTTTSSPTSSCSPARC